MAEDSSVQTGGAAASQDQHDHTFYIKFKGEQRKHKVNCTEPQTVLEAIKSRKEYRQLGWSDDEIVIQWGKEDKENIIATHFPCSCLNDEDILIVSKTSEMVEEVRDDRPILPKDEYSVFYIYKEGGKNSKRKQLFKNNEVKKFKFLCVYGERDITVQEALQRDGRFVKLTDFKLSDYSDEERVIECSEIIDQLNGQRFKIVLPRNRAGGGAASATEQQTGVRNSPPGPSGEANQRGFTWSFSALLSALNHD